MSVAIQNYEIEQGDDAEVSLVYRTAEGEEEPAPVDLTTGYSVRMDIAVDGTGLRVWTFNSDDDAGPSPIDEPGSGDNETVLGSEGQIAINVPRALTLPDGAIWDAIEANQLVFKYDLFLRNPDNKQHKVLKGTITFNKSVTLWE